MLYPTSGVSMDRDLSKYDYQTVLNNWDLKHEQGKADFLDFLYDLYRPTNHCYTGLYQQFAQDLLECYRDAFIAGDLKVNILVESDDSDSFNNSGEPFCDV